MRNFYGEPPHDLGTARVGAWTEFMHYLYLPVRIPASDPGLRSIPEGVRHESGGWCRFPANLWFLVTTVVDAMEDARQEFEHLQDPYVYITARRGWASPGNPLNRPGWHCDDFGGTDVNYIWTDAYPTRFLESDTPLTISEDDQTSMRDMALWAAHAKGGMGSRIVTWPTHHLLRLSPYVIHDTPLIPEPGGMRSFFKISVSTHRYDLIGNSHNYELDYEWEMHDRQTLRNQPQGGNRDYSGVEPTTT